MFILALKHATKKSRVTSAAAKNYTLRKGASEGVLSSEFLHLNVNRLQGVSRTSNTTAALVQYVSVNHRRFDCPPTDEEVQQVHAD